MIVGAGVVGCMAIGGQVVTDIATGTTGSMGDYAMIGFRGASSGAICSLLPVGGGMLGVGLSSVAEGVIDRFIMGEEITLGGSLLDGVFGMLTFGIGDNVVRGLKSTGQKLARASGKKLAKKGTKELTEQASKHTTKELKEKVVKNARRKTNLDIPDNSIPPKMPKTLPKNPMPTPEELSASVQEWARMEQALTLNMSKRQANRFNTATVVYDARTKEYYYGMNRGVWLSGDRKNPILFGDGKSNGLLPKETLNDFLLGNCAEIDAVNQALNNGATLSDLHMYTIHTHIDQFGKAKKACENCTYTFKGKLANVITGFED